MAAGRSDHQCPLRLHLPVDVGEVNRISDVRPRNHCARAELHPGIESVCALYERADVEQGSRAVDDGARRAVGLRRVHLRHDESVASLSSMHGRDQQTSRCLQLSTKSELAVKLSR